jgi:hypothetical protein
MILVKLNNGVDTSGGVTYIKGEEAWGGYTRDSKIELDKPLETGAYAFFV